MRERVPYRWFEFGGLCFVLLVVSAAATGCARSDAKPRKEKKAVVKPTSNRPYLEQDAPPEPLFIEEKLVPSRTTSGPRATRVLQDGTCWTFSDRVFVLKDGRIREERVPGKWRWKDERLSDDEMDSLKRVIREKVLSSPIEIPSNVQVQDGLHIYWTIVLDQKRHTIHWVEGLRPMPTALKELDSMFANFLENARDRWRQQYGSPSRTDEQEQ